MTETERDMIASLVVYYGADAVRREVEDAVEDFRRLDVMTKTGRTPQQQRATEAAKRPANVVRLRPGGGA